MSARSDRMRKVVMIVALVITLGVASFGLTHWFVYRSDAYATAIKHVQTSPELTAMIGAVSDTRLSWLEHTTVEELEINGVPGGNAQFTVIVKGASGSLAVPMELIRDERGWRVTSAMVRR